VPTDIESLDTVDAVAVPLERVPLLTGLSRTRLFGAVKEGRLTIRKDGKSSIVDWPRSGAMSNRCRRVDASPTKQRPKCFSNSFSQ
jgi:hypothetical protein